MPKNLTKNLRPRRISLGLKNLSIKKPSAKGALLKSEKKENGLWLYGFAARMVKGFRQTALPYDDTVIRYEPRKRKPNNDNFGFGVSDLKRRHKVSFALASIAIIGIVVFFQFAPEKATRGTFESFAV